MDIPHQVGHVAGPCIGTPQEQEQKQKVMLAVMNYLII